MSQMNFFEAIGETTTQIKNYVDKSKVPVNNNGWNLIETDWEETSYTLDKTNYCGTYIAFKTPVYLETGEYIVKLKYKGMTTFRLNTWSKLIATDANFSVPTNDVITPTGNCETYQDVVIIFNVTKPATFESVYLQYAISDLSADNVIYVKELQLLDIKNKDLPYISKSLSGYLINFSDNLKVPRNEIVLEEYESWIPTGWIQSQDRQTIDAVATSDGQLCYAGKNGQVIRYKVLPNTKYLLVQPKHKKGYPICIEYEKDDLTKPTNVLFSDVTNIKHVITTGQNVHYLSVCSHMCATGTLYNIPFANGIYAEDMYTYDEVLKEGYLPNPDNGYMDWRWNKPSLDNVFVNHIFDYFTFGQFYHRYSWQEMYNTDTNEYDFSKIKEDFEKAITYKTRIQIGAFSSLYPAHEDNVIEYDDKVVWYNFPTYIYDIGYNAEKYPIKFCKYTSKQVNGKPVYNAVIDWRNDTIRQEYKSLLKKLSDFLDTESSVSGVTYRQIVSSIQIRFWGKYGEGHNDEYIQDYADDMETSDVLISIVDMYLEYFDDIRLIAPIGCRGSNSLSNGLSEWQKYYITAENSVGKFGIFNDHFGASLSFKDALRHYDGVDLLEDYGTRWKYAPVTGENYNNGEYNSNLLSMQYLINDCYHYRINTYRANNVTGSGKTPSYKHPSVKKMIQKSFDMCGYRFFFLPIATYIENSKVYVRFRIGNMGLTPCYSNFWNAQVVLRNSDGDEIHIIDNVFDCQTVQMMKEPMIPSWKYTDTIVIEDACKTDVDYANVSYYLRVIDKLGISNNMYLANVGRTDIGEYPILLDASSTATFEVLNNKLAKIFI